MTCLRFRSPAEALFAVAILLAMPPLMTVRAGAMKGIASAPALLADTALIMGGTGMPDPPPWFIDEVNDIYIQPNFPGYTPVGLHTPEEAWPIFGSLSGQQSVAEGLADLHTAITDTYAGDNLLVFGVSQSALIAGLEMRDLVNNPPDGLGELHFALLGGPANPMGGIFERFADLHFPGLDLAQYPPTPTDAFPTDIYSGEYDGVSDFPRYPLNILSVLNAIAGVATVHLGYGDLTADQVASAVHLGHSGLTDFYMIPTQVLPILQPLYESSDLGKMVVDAIQPQLKVLVDLGYGNLEHGVLPDPGGVDAAGLIGFVPRLDPLAVKAALQLGQVQGIVNVTNDIRDSAGLPPLSDHVTDMLKSALGYDNTMALDQELTSWLTQLSTTPGLQDLNPDILFDGSPLFSGAPVIEAVNQYLDEVFWWAA